MTTNKIIIEGAEQAVRCDCCNRPLKVGVRTNAFGTIGADCLIAKVAPNRAKYSGNGLPTASWVRELAVIRETKTPRWMELRGHEPRHFVFEARA